MSQLVNIDQNGRRYIVNCCDTCGKIIEGIHTCTPSPYLQHLQAEIARLTAELAEAKQRGLDAASAIATENRRLRHALMDKEKELAELRASPQSLSDDALLFAAEAKRCTHDCNQGRDCTCRKESA